MQQHQILNTTYGEKIEFVNGDNIFPGIQSEKYCRKVAHFIEKAIAIALPAKEKTKKLKDFKEFVDSDAETARMCDALRKEVNEFSLAFPMPGHDDY